MTKPREDASKTETPRSKSNSEPKNSAPLPFSSGSEGTRKKNKIKRVCLAQRTVSYKGGGRGDDRKRMTRQNVGR